MEAKYLIIVDREGTVGLGKEESFRETELEPRLWAQHPCTNTGSLSDTALHGLWGTQLPPSQPQMADPCCKPPHLSSTLPIPEWLFSRTVGNSRFNPNLGVLVPQLSAWWSRCSGNIYGIALDRELTSHIYVIFRQDLLFGFTDMDTHFSRSPVCSLLPEALLNHSSPWSPELPLSSEISHHSYVSLRISV